MKRNDIINVLTETTKGTVQDFFTEEELSEFADTLIEEGSEIANADDLVDEFVEYWRGTERQCERCSYCGKIMVSGYVLGDYHACNDECRIELYKRECDLDTDEEADEMFESDAAYYGDCNYGIKVCR